MRKKNPHSFRFSPEAESELKAEAGRTGKSLVAVLEDLLLGKRQFGEEADAAIQFLATKHKLPPRKVVEFCVLKAADVRRDLPFSHLAAA